MKLSAEQPQLNACCGNKGSPIGYKYMVSFYHMTLVHTCRILTVKVPPKHYVHTHYTLYWWTNSLELGFNGILF